MKKISVFTIILFLSALIFAEETAPTQSNFGKRKISENSVSFLSLNCDSSREDLVSYLNKYQISYKTKDVYRGSGSLDYVLYEIEDLNFLGIDFSKIIVKFIPEPFEHFYYELDSIICYPLVKEDLNKFTDYCNKTYEYSKKDRVYYGQPRYYSNNERHKYTIFYENKSSNIIFFDEIGINYSEGIIEYNFTIERDKSILDINDINKDLIKEYQEYIQPIGTKTDKTVLQKIYFARIDKNGYVNIQETTRTVPETEYQLYETIKVLLEGVSNQESENGLVSFIPKNAELIYVQIKNNIAYINFNESFLEQEYGLEGARIQLQQIVYTATEFPEIHSVQILINERKETFLGETGFFIGRELKREMF